ncbi:MAG TPA: complex I NDUFA9 subunit family protein [Verrucomicrobiae bacterium]|nr:complex I NDUFA9 subunit family protein [Verrucomicrobiae bacterium]
MKILVTGATGFVGREIVRQLHAASHRVRVLVRDPQGRSARELIPAFAAESHAGNVLVAASLPGAATSCDAIIHLVGLISEFGEQTFENVHRHATQNLLAEAQRAGVRRWIHMSALGTRPNARSRYHQTKWAAEEAVRASGLDWTIFRPSLIYGPGDGFVNLFARISRRSPVLPVMGSGQNLFQPVSVAEVARCFVGALNEPASVGKMFDVCGPERLSYDAVLDAVLHATHRRRLKLHVPLPLARLAAAALEFLFPVLLRQAPPLNRDQLLMLKEDNVGEREPAAAQFGLTAKPFAEGIAAYLK